MVCVWSSGFTQGSIGVGHGTSSTTKNIESKEIIKDHFVGFFSHNKLGVYLRLPTFAYFLGFPRLQYNKWV